MPTYEYECTKCGCVFDLFQSITEPPRKRLKKSDPRPCDCNAPVARRITGGGGLIFKGSGFYLTDYRSESYKKAAKAETDGAKSGEKADGTAEPAKPAKKVESKSAEKPAAPKKKRAAGE
jgi:putative FmdB family regulatory protein